MERVLELVNIAANKNTVPGDKSALIPHGLRLGSPAMTTRGLTADAFTQVVAYIDRAIALTIKFNATVEGTRLRDFKEALGDGSSVPEIAELRAEVSQFSDAYYCPK